MYETFAHTADLGLRVRAGSLDELFAEAGMGLLSMLVDNPASVQPAKEVSLAIDKDDVEYQLFDWLTELLYLFETERLLLSTFEVRVADGNISAVCRGEEMDLARHQMGHEVKAITYHGLSVQRSAGEWLAEVIVDI